MDEYDITEAFAKIENELIASAMRNMDRHRAEETELGYNWSAWQTEQLQALERYKKLNAKKYGKEFKKINGSIDAMISSYRAAGGSTEEIRILKAIKDGFTSYKKVSPQVAGSFFRMNDRKMDALINATKNDLKTAETAMLRMANDKYRSTIYNAQVYFNSGAGTYEKAVDMAIKDYLRAGINCVEYSNGAKHSLEDYAGMSLRTANKRATLTGEGEKRKEWGVSTVIIKKRGNPCPKCLPFVGKVLIDDVWSGGHADDGDFPLMSYAMECGLYHPNCKDGHTTYFEDVSPKPDAEFTRQEVKDIVENNKRQAAAKQAARKASVFQRMADNSLDPLNKKTYQARADEWSKRSEGLKMSDGKINTTDSLLDAYDEYFGKSVAKSSVSDTIVSGAVSGARNPFGKAASKHAEKYYGLVRSMTTDVEKIAKTSGYSETQIQEIKDFIFI